MILVAANDAAGKADPPRRRQSWLRLGIILALGAACIAAAEFYRRSRRPKPCPPDVQQEGMGIVESILDKVRPTELGRSRRGILLEETISRLLRRGRVIFTAGLRTQALHRREGMGFEALYVRVHRLAGRFVHLKPDEIAEGLYHEAVHARQGRHSGSSIEEECDGYAAGLCAGAAVEGVALPDLLTVEGQPVAEFVVRAYADLPRCPTYEPVGESIEWLQRRTGLR